MSEIIGNNCNVFLHFFKGADLIQTVQMPGNSNVPRKGDTVLLPYKYKSENPPITTMRPFTILGVVWDFQDSRTAHQNQFSTTVNFQVDR